MAVAVAKSKRKHAEIIKSVLGNYLKQRNYTLSPKVPANDLDWKMDETIKNDITRKNSFSYSNCFCLNNPNNHPGLVDQQFSKVCQFIRNYKVPAIRQDLETLLPPLMCHLYVEMLKGQDWKVAIQFLRKHASIVGQIDNGNSFAKVNGTVDDSALHAMTISFVDESSDEKNLTFRQLICALSAMRNLQDLDNNELTADFRSCKYQISLSERAVAILKVFLAKNAHVIIIQTLQIWFHIDPSEDKVPSDNDDEVMEDSFNCSGGGLNGFSSLDDISKFTNLLASPKSTPTKADYKVEEEEEEVIEEPGKVEEDFRLKSLEAILERIETHQNPTQIFCVKNSSEFSMGDMDPCGCHVACAFEDSTIVLWSADRSMQTGRKPYAKFCSRNCDWSILQTENSDNDGVSSDEEVVNQKQQKMAMHKKFKRKKDHDEFMSKRCPQNTIDDISGYKLRGHTHAVTDVLFSTFSPLLLSTSRDLTMRAWRASDYSCAAIYRGHNYPVWCVAESSTGLYLATGSRDATARLWSTDREFPFQMYVGHTQDVTSVAFHPNGNYLATGSVDLTVRLWDVTSGKILRVFNDCRLPVYRVAFSPNGKYLAAAGEESRVRIFDIAGGAQLCELKDHAGAVTDLVWKPDSAGLATTTNSGVIRMYDLSSFDQSQSNLPSTSSHHPHATLLQQFGTPCKRIVKLKLSSGALTCIGNN